MTIVEKIHQEIDTAEDRLLAEARRIIALNINTSDKAERLERIGFTGSEIVIRNKAKKNVLVTGKDQASLIEYYKQNYPFQKFLTELEFDRICKKYNLIYAPIANYKRDVPENNLKDLENVSSVAAGDIAEDKISCRLKRDNSFFLVASSGGDWSGIWGTEWWRIPTIIQGKHFFSNYDADRYLRDKLGFTTEYLVRKIENITINKQGLFIAAPQSHFDLKGLHREGLLNANFSITIIEPKDPIVFRYVRGGIQVITKWGLEAEDKDLVNEKMN